ncbi:MAG TPA: hypothetical protein VGL56_13335 [Fimbriimonadaceae bacterium]|jgi:hypothetical protein
MQYCNWCHLNSDTDDFCIWCKRPFNAAPSLFNMPKRPDFHLLQTDEDTSDLQVPIFTGLGILVFAGILTVAYFNLHRNKAVVQAGPAVTNLGELRPNSQNFNNPARLEFSGNPGTGSPTRPVASAGGNSAFQRPPAIPGGSAAPQSDSDWKSGTITHMNAVAVHGETAEEVGAPTASAIYFEIAKLTRQDDRNGVSHLTAEVVLVNNAHTSFSGGQLWLKIGDTRLKLRPFTGTLEHPRDLGLISLPAGSHFDFHVYAEGFKKEMNVANQQKTIGLDGLVADAPYHTSGEIT